MGETNRRERESKVPVVTEISITPENFHILHGRIWFVKGDDHHNYRYEPVHNFETFLSQQWAVCIQLAKIPHEDLEELNPTVGFLNSETKQFDYYKYNEWAAALGVRAYTREELVDKFEGQPPGWTL